LKPFGYPASVRNCLAFPTLWEKVLARSLLYHQDSGVVGGPYRGEPCPKNAAAETASRSIANAIARRTRESSKGFLLVLNHRFMKAPPSDCTSSPRSFFKASMSFQGTKSIISTARERRAFTRAPSLEIIRIST